MAITDGEDNIVFECKGSSSKQNIKTQIKKGIKQKNDVSGSYYKKLVFGTYINENSEKDPNSIHIVDPDFPDYSHYSIWDIQMLHMLKAFEYSGFTESFSILKKILVIKEKLKKSENRRISDIGNNLLNRFEKLQLKLKDKFQEELKELQTEKEGEMSYVGKIIKNEYSNESIFLGTVVH